MGDMIHQVEYQVMRGSSIQLDSSIQWKRSAVVSIFLLMKIWIFVDELYIRYLTHDRYYYSN